MLCLYIKCKYINVYACKYFQIYTVCVCVYIHINIYTQYTYIYYVNKNLAFRISVVWAIHTKDSNFNIN